jgi:hypothetical protein
MSRRRRDASGSTAMRWPRTVSIPCAHRACFLDVPASPSVRPEGHPSVPFAPPQSSFTPLAAILFRVSHSPTRVSGPPHDITRSRPPVGVSLRSLSRDHAGACAHRTSGVAEGSQHFRFGPSSGSLSLPTVCSAIGLAGLFHPAAMSRTAPVQGLLHPRSRASLLERPPAPLPLTPSMLTGCPAATRSVPRLRGFAPRE